MTIYVRVPGIFTVIPRGLRRCSRPWGRRLRRLKKLGVVSFVSRIMLERSRGEGGVSCFTYVPALSIEASLLNRIRAFTEESWPGTARLAAVSWVTSTMTDGLKGRMLTIYILERIETVGLYRVS